MGDEPCKEKEIPPEISTDARERIKKEEIPIEISTDPGDTRKTPRKVKAEEDEEEHVNTKGKAILEIGIDGQYRLQNTEKYPTTSSGGDIARDDITVCVTEENPIMSNQQPVLMSEEKSFSCSECGKCFTRKHSLIVHQRLHTGEKPYLCLECGKCFYSRPQLHDHQKTHPEVAAFSCSKCLKRFRTSRILALHQSIHSR
ncbi:uncharacterized protein [Aquarana catesbeiana]